MKHFAGLRLFIHRQPSIESHGHPEFSRSPGTVERPTARINSTAGTVSCIFTNDGAGIALGEPGTADTSSRRHCDVGVAGLFHAAEEHVAYGHPVVAACQR